MARLYPPSVDQISKVRADVDRSALSRHGRLARCMADFPSGNDPPARAREEMDITTVHSSDALPCARDQLSPPLPAYIAIISDDRGMRRAELRGEQVAIMLSRPRDFLQGRETRRDI
jgi:hypothetical protein